MLIENSISGMTDSFPDERTTLDDFGDISSIEVAMEGFLENISKEGDSGNYRRSVSGFFNNRWRDWLIRNNLTSLSQIDKEVMSEYASHLAECTEDEQIAASTAQTYFHYISAFLGWCREQDLIVTNPATYSEVQEHLPEEAAKKEQQFWSDEKLERLLEAVNRSAIVADSDEKLIANRNRALVYLVSFSGALSAELLKSSEDNRRDGLSWGELNFDTYEIEVLGKSQELELVPIPRPAREPLETLYELQSPESPDWKVFFTGHSPSQTNTLKEGLMNQGYQEEEINTILSEGEPWELFHEYDISPPPLTVDGGRNLLKRICKDNDIEIDGDYLKPFGARRHLGQQLFDESVSTAQKRLRNQTIGSIHERYSE